MVSPIWVAVMPVPHTELKIEEETAIEDLLRYHRVGIASASLGSSYVKTSANCVKTAVPCLGTPRMDLAKPGSIAPVGILLPYENIMQEWNINCARVESELCTRVVSADDHSR